MVFSEHNHWKFSVTITVTQFQLFFSLLNHSCFPDIFGGVFVSLPMMGMMPELGGAWGGVKEGRGSPYEGRRGRGQKVWG